MSRVYSVKSNARRDCRKIGLDPDLVVAKGSGWVINYPDAAKPAKKAKAKVAKPKAARAPKSAKTARPPRASRTGEPKRDRLIAMLVDWTPISDLMAAMGWQPHTVRGALSTAAKNLGIIIERRRVDKVTSYRAVERQKAAA